MISLYVIGILVCENQLISNNVPLNILVFLGHFIKRDNIWCSPRAPMTSKNVEGGKRECLNDPKCFMFYKFGEGKRFYSCSSTASIKVSSQGSTLYQTNGNQNISVIYITLKTYLIYLNTSIFGLRYFFNPWFSIRMQRHAT